MNPNRKLEALFDLAPIQSETVVSESEPEEVIVSRSLTTANRTLERIQAALPTVRELERVDSELDEIATQAMTSFADLSDLGMQVDSRFAAEIFSVASSMMGHAISAKTAKANRKLKTLDLQLKQYRLELDSQRAREVTANPVTGAPIEQAEGQILSRNQLMAMLGDRGATPEQDS